MKTFWVVLILVILFVIGSASALNYFGNKSSKFKKNSDDKDDLK